MKKLAKTALMAFVALGAVGATQAMEAFDPNMGGFKAKLKAKQYHDEASRLHAAAGALAHFAPFVAEPFTNALGQAAIAPHDMDPAYNAAKGALKAAVTQWVGELVPAGGHILDIGVTVAPANAAGGVFGKAALPAVDRDNAANLANAINAVIDQQDAASFAVGLVPLAHPANGKVKALEDSVSSLKVAVNAALDAYLDQLGVGGGAAFLEPGVAAASVAMAHGNVPIGDTLNDFKNAIHGAIADVVL
ncbi:MAG: hypothetical protein K0R52_940 [Alphaproteobacteria bacterium]|jgi:hypothetical protein|nr:hypothetical protein [Alphaproteobacteria bacterium]